MSESLSLKSNIDLSSIVFKDGIGLSQSLYHLLNDWIQNIDESGLKNDETIQLNKKPFQWCFTCARHLIYHAKKIEREAVEEEEGKKRIKQMVGIIT